MPENNEKMLDCSDFESDSDAPEWWCCGTCHYGNLYEDDVRTYFDLIGGREAELCCGKIRKLVAMGLLREKALSKAFD